MSIRQNIDNLLRTFEKEYVTHNLIEVSSSALLHNLDVFSCQADRQVIPVLKANAYGHGIELVATALKARELPYIAVDGYFEALRIREVSDQPVLVMGAILPENFARMKYDRFTFVVQDKKTVDALGKTGKHIKVHLEANTGMNRYGAKPDEMVTLAKRVLEYENLELEGVMSHLADSDGDDPVTVDEAVEQFDGCVESIRALGADPKILHIAQTAGSIKAKSKYANTIRLGIGLYGVSPFPRNHALSMSLRHKLQPALKLTSTITKITELEKGDKVSYNYTFTAQKRMKIGVLPLGYYEGAWTLTRGVGRRAGDVKRLDGKYAPIVGRVCMNHTIIGLDGTDAIVGDKVVVYSNDPTDRNSIDNIADEYKLFNYAILTSLNRDVRRRLVG